MSSNVVVKRQDWMTDEVYEWACLEEKARQNTFARLMKQGRKALVAIKAQHPLNSDGTPGPEYEQRLEKALRVKCELEEDGLEVDFMTFGGVHSGHETITLADAGADWLMEHGVGADAIQRCPVVYSGNDEDRMAAEKFAADESYSQLHVVMSAGQWNVQDCIICSAGGSRQIMRLLSWTTARITARFVSCGVTGQCRLLRKEWRRSAGLRKRFGRNI